MAMSQQLHEIDNMAFHLGSQAIKLERDHTASQMTILMTSMSTVMVESLKHRTLIAVYHGLHLNQH